MPDSRLKTYLQENLSLSSRLLVKRIFVGTVGAGVRLAARAVNFIDRLLDLAVTHGLDLHRAWNVRPKPQPLPSQSWSAQDFLFVMDKLKGETPAQLPSSEIRASIIIPVFNKVEFTFQCLRSLLRVIDFRENEVIVVNNASRDETAQVLAHFGDLVRVINNEENRGFVDACNQGAAAARGKYLVFLNNDTVVLPGWLEHLVETAESDEEVGAVGSLFLYPNGRIQEAGAIVWRTGEAFHYGWGQAPDDPRYNFAREVDYCSGASLLIRRELFAQIGCFDRLYAPAYYEDADLCFSVRAHGCKVIYQPASRLIHYEGATAGTDTRTGIKHFQVVNREKFFAKWRAVLEREHFAYDPALVEMAANRKRGPSFLVFDDRVPVPERDAGGARMIFILKTLAKRGRPVFVSVSKRIWLEQEKNLWRAGIETSTQTEFLRLMKNRRFHAAVLSRPEIAEALLPALRRADPQLKIIFDMVDAHFIRSEREFALSGEPAIAEAARRYRAQETRIARLSDLIWCNSSEDKRVMEREAPGVRIEVIPTIHRLRERGQPFERRAHLLFLGNFIHRPNSDALRYFAQEIFPLVREAIPDAKLYVVGDNAPPDVAAFATENVKILGYVPDLEPLWQSCRMLVAPLRFGAGVKGKIGEALAHGLPVVTTSMGAEGMSLRHGAEAMIADTPQDFAACVAEVYHDRALWQRLADNGYSHLEKHFTPPVIEQVIYDSLSALDSIEVSGQYEEKSEVRSQKSE